MKTHPRLIVVSNRLPITVESSNGALQVHQSDGGLVNALVPILERTGGCWIGWTGGDDGENRNPIFTSAGETYAVEPVFLTAAEKSAYYDGFSNEIVWPLFHGLPSRCRFSSAYWNGYCIANGRFADVVQRVAQCNDFVWVHDYHLMILAGALRNRGLEQRLGYFHHIPFPSPDIFETLPWRENVLNGLLQFNSIGFQTENDRNNFLACLKRYLPNVRISDIGNGVLARNQAACTKIGVYPISVDYETLAAESSQPSISALAKTIRSRLGDTRILLGVDRLDYTKGIPERLASFQTVLSRNPELCGKVALLQFVVPSREDIPEYTNLKLRIETLASKINGQYGVPGWTPVQYFHRSVPRNELIALYRLADAALVTPLKDGMNLVAKEFCAARIDSKGVLVLSEFAGAAEELKCGALLVNPHDTDVVAAVIRNALQMREREQRVRMDAMRSHIRTHNVFAWARSFDIDDIPAANPVRTDTRGILQFA
jgi:alpha,alpha-trehalose-phosphate synthase [UDP-forming]